MNSLLLKVCLVFVFHNEICFGYQIFVKSLSGKTVTIDVDSSDLIMNVKMQIQDKEHIPPERQILVYKGKQLQDGRPLAYYGIGKEYSIYMFLRSQPKVRAPQLADRDENSPTCKECVQGDCVGDNLCACHAGWAGIGCKTCQPRVDCQFGYCENHPFECKCFSNYNGSACDQPVCREGCHPEHGYCDVPETCICKPGWSGLNCDKCVPYWNCNGYCENEPWECICPDGKSGPDCKDDGDIDGNWGKWSEWSACTVKCGIGERKRTRQCDSPRTQGEGKYCSHDGSRSDQIEGCYSELSCQNDKVPRKPKKHGLVREIRYQAREPLMITDMKMEMT